MGGSCERIECAAAFIVSSHTTQRHCAVHAKGAGPGFQRRGSFRASLERVLLCSQEDQPEGSGAYSQKCREEQNGDVMHDMFD
jgi:hypothetical protein